MSYVILCIPRRWWNCSSFVILAERSRGHSITSIPSPRETSTWFWRVTTTLEWFVGYGISSSNFQERVCIMTPPEPFMGSSGIQGCELKWCLFRNLGVTVDWYFFVMESLLCIDTRNDILYLLYSSGYHACPNKVASGAKPLIIEKM